MIDIDEQPKIVLILFELINYIAKEIITMPREILEQII